MNDLFEEIIASLGRIFHLKLHTDKHHACSIQIPPLTVQLQLDPAQEKLFLFCKLIELPPGKFRENVLGEALKANHLPDPRLGLLSYLAISNHLVLYQRYPLSILSGERLASLFGGFLELALSWQKAIQAGQNAPPGTSSKPSPPFGLKP